MRWLRGNRRAFAALVTGEPFFAVAEFKTGRADNVVVLTNTMPAAKIDIGYANTAEITKMDVHDCQFLFFARARKPYVLAPSPAIAQRGE